MTFFGHRTPSPLKSRGYLANQTDTGRNVEAGSRARRRRAVLAGATALAAALSLTACIPFGPQGPAFTPDPNAASGAPGDLQKFYTQKLEWTSCENKAECAKLTVPVDYSAPDGASIQLALINRKATGTAQGYIVVNPGGPGGSGYDMVKDAGQKPFSADLRSHFNIVGFDPRGVKRSAPVTCLTDEEIDASRQETMDPGTEAGYRKAVAEAADVAKKCQEKTGPVLGFVDTVSAAKDMDVMRAVLGEAKLNYLGYSYGTKLGATYADLFSGRVGRFVLDGALDPTLTIETLGMGQAKAFEVAFADFTKNCLSSKSCPMRGSVEDAVQQVRDLNESYQNDPKQTSDGRLLTGAGFSSALALGMYSNSLWPDLQAALGKAFAGDPNGMMALADYSADRDPSSGKYTSNSNFAFTAVNCLDYRTTADQSAMQAESKALQAASPTFGKYLGYSGVACESWPFKSTVNPHPISSPDSGPIVVIGTSKDPATPYEWAVNLRKQLAHGVLVSWDGDGHTAYGRSNDCVTKAVDNYFIKGQAPEDGLKC